MSRVAIVHERFTDLAGSERVVAALAQIWPEADVFAPVVDPSALPPGLDAHRVTDTWLRQLYRGGRSYAHILPLLPSAMRSMRFDEYDLVITSHHAFANRVRPSKGTPVLSYTHTPARWLWEPDMRQGEAGGFAGHMLLSTFAATQRPADRAAAQRLSRVVANSSAVAERIRTHWGRNAQIVHPPVDLDYYTPDPAVQREDFFLVAGRLVPYKRADVAVAAAVAAGVQLVVVGDGRGRAAAMGRAGPGRVTFLGRVPDRHLRDLYRRCRALLMPGVEDFGIVPVEAMACGAPVVGVAAGGLLDSVIPGVCGELVKARSERELIEGMSATLRCFDDSRYGPDTLNRLAQRFSSAAFARRMREVAADLIRN